jgi:hypothetical protein
MLVRGDVVKRIALEVRQIAEFDNWSEVVQEE